MFVNNNFKDSNISFERRISKIMKADQKTALNKLLGFGIHMYQLPDKDGLVRYASFGSFTQRKISNLKKKFSTSLRNFLPVLNQKKPTQFKTFVEKAYKRGLLSYIDDLYNLGFKVKPGVYIGNDEGIKNFNCDVPLVVSLGTKKNGPRVMRDNISLEMQKLLREKFVQNKNVINVNVKGNEYVIKPVNLVDDEYNKGWKTFDAITIDRLK